MLEMQLEKVNTQGENECERMCRKHFIVMHSAAMEIFRCRQRFNSTKNVESYFSFRADLDGDALLSLQELARYINRRIREHIEASIRNNPIIFYQIDQSPRNGLITWDEYYVYFLKTLGYDDAFIRQVDRKRNTNLDRKTKELLMRDKALWNEAARSDSYTLTLDEFLAFKHPGN